MQCNADHQALRCPVREHSQLIQSSRSTGTELVCANEKPAN